MFLVGFAVREIGDGHLFLGVHLSSPSTSLGNFWSSLHLCHLIAASGPGVFMSLFIGFGLRMIGLVWMTSGMPGVLTGAEESLFRAYCRVGGPVAGNPQMHLGRGRLRVRIRRLVVRSAGAACSSRLYRVSQGDEVDAHSAQYFVNSSLAPVLLFRRRIKSVADALKGIRQRVFSQARVDALHRYWACCLSTRTLWARCYVGALG